MHILYAKTTFTLKNFKYGLFIVNMYMLVRRLWRKQDRMYFRRTYARTRICIRTYVSLLVYKLTGSLGASEFVT